MSTVLTASVVGAGTGGKLSLAALNSSPHFRLVAVADPDEGALAYARQTYPGIQTFTDYLSLFANCAPDVVCVSTPPTTHEEVALTALALPLQGILVEKPLGHNAASGTRILQAIRQHILPVAVPHGLLVRPTPRRVMKHILDGDIGDLTLIEIQCTGWDIINAGIHWLDFCVHATGMPDVHHVIAQCDAATRTYRDGMQVETLAVTYVQTMAGTRIVMQTGDYVDIAHETANTLMRFVGTKGQIEFWPWHEGYRILNASRPDGVLITPENHDGRTGHQIHLDTLADEIARGQPDYVIAEGSLRALEICEAAYLSSRYRCQIPFPLTEFVPPFPVTWNPGMPYAGTGGGRNGRAL